MPAKVFAFQAPDPCPLPLQSFVACLHGPVGPECCAIVMSVPLQAPMPSGLLSTFSKENWCPKCGACQGRRCVVLRPFAVFSQTSGIRSVTTSWLREMQFIGCGGASVRLLPMKLLAPKGSGFITTLCVAKRFNSGILGLMRRNSLQMTIPAWLRKKRRGACCRVRVGTSRRPG